MEPTRPVVVEDLHDYDAACVLPKNNNKYVSHLDT